MRQRCNNPNNRDYRLYGALGVRVCERWDSFENFRVDMGECPTGMSLDRIEPSGNYEPKNCRWATSIAQANNKRASRKLTVLGKTGTVSELARVFGHRPATVYNRIRIGWDVEQAFVIPLTDNTTRHALIGERNG